MEQRVNHWKVILFVSMMMVVVLVVAHTPTLAQAALARPPAASVSVNPTSGPAGSVVTVSGSAFALSNPPYIIFWNSIGGTQLGTFNPGGGGGWTTNVTIPGGASPGNHLIFACGGYGGEFQECVSAVFFVTTSATDTPALPTTTFTPVNTPTITPTPTATLSACIDEIEVLSPASRVDLGGVATIELVFAVTFGGDGPPEVLIHVNDRWTPYTQWPDPTPGRSVTMAPDPENSYRYIYTVRRIPIRRGLNEVMIDVPSTCRSRSREYHLFGNAEPFTPTPRPSICGDLGLGEDAALINFESNHLTFFLSSMREDYGLLFGPTFELRRPESILPRSSRTVGASTSSIEFGSSLRPIQMSFLRPLAALGMFVGLEENTYVDTEVTATLQVFGLRAGTSKIVELGRASVSFPPEPSDVAHCLKFEAEEGDAITSASLEYTDSFGTSMAERRIMDDLTLLYMKGVEIPDEPPNVSITFPEDGSTVELSTITGRATVQEDVELSQTWVRLNDGEWQEVAFSPDSTSPMRHLIASVLDPSQLLYRGENTFEVRAEDASGQQGLASSTFTFAPEQPLTIQNLEYRFTQSGVFDIAGIPPALVAGKTGAMQVSGIPQLGGSLVPVTIEDMHLNVLGPGGDTSTYRAYRKVGVNFEAGGPFSGAMEAYFFIPGSQLPPGGHSFTLLLDSGSEEVDTVPLGRGVFFTIPHQYQFHAPVQDPFTGINGIRFFEQMANMSRIFPVPDRTAPFGSPLARSGEAGIVYAIPPGVIDLPNGRNPETDAPDFAWDFIYDGSASRFRLLESRSPLVDCNADGVVDTNDPALPALRAAADSSFLTGVSDPPGHVQWDWSKPEDVDGDGSVTPAEIALWVIEFYDLDGDGTWHAYSGADRALFTPGDPYLTFDDQNGNCVLDGAEATSKSPGTLRKENAWNYMRTQAEQMMDAFAAANGLDRMSTSAVLSAERTSSLGIVGNCGTAGICWSTTSPFTIGHEVGHGWGLDHDTPKTMDGGALNLIERIWVPESNTHNFIFTSIGQQSWQNFASYSRFAELYSRGLGGWDYFAGSRSTSAAGLPVHASSRAGLQAPEVSEVTFALYAYLDLAGDLVIEDTRVYRAQISTLPQPGPYLIVFLTEDGEQLGMTAFGVMRETVCDGCPDEEEIVRFEMPRVSVLAPFPEGTERVEIRLEGQILHALDVSLRAPTVRWVGPNAGLIARDTPTVLRWEGSDPDGDDLTYSLAYTPDGGETIIPFAAGLRGESYSWTPGFVAGSPEAVILVTANDGFHSVTARSPQLPLSSGEPMVTILSPRAGQTYGHLSTISLVVEAIDPEDGPLSGDSVVWIDAMGETLGVGNQLLLEGYPVGEHQIYVTATDSEGRSVTEQVLLSVVQSPEPASVEIVSGIQLLTSPTQSAYETCEPSELEISADFPAQLEVVSAILLVDAEGLPQNPIAMQSGGADNKFRATLKVDSNQPAGTWQIVAIGQGEVDQWWSEALSFDLVACPQTGEDGLEGLAGVRKILRTGLTIAMIVAGLGLIGFGIYWFMRRERAG